MKKHIKVLLIEDNPGDARLIQEYLKEAPGTSFEVGTAETLAKGLELLDEGGIDIALLDLTLPDSNKEDTFLKVRGHSPGLPIVILSGFDDSEFAIGLVRMGAQDYLMKGDLNSELLVRVILYAIERKKADAVRQLTQYTIDHTSDAAFWIDRNANLVNVNQTACRKLGYSREELLGMTVHDIDPDFPKEAWLGHWEELERRGSFSFESHHRTMSGNIFPVEITVNYLEFEGEKFNFTFARDITERKTVEEVLSLIRKGTASLVGAEFFNALVQNLAGALRVDVGFVAQVISGEGNRARMLSLRDSNGFLDTFEYNLKGTPCDLTRKENFCFYPSDVADYFPDDPWLRENGMQCYQAIRLEDVEGNILGHMGVMHRKPMREDKSHVSVLKIFASRAVAEMERMRSEEQLSEQSKSMRAILESAPIGIWRLGADKRIKFINSTFCDAVGVEERRFLEAEHYSNLLPEDVSRNCMASDKVCLETREQDSRIEEIPCVDGKLHTFEIIKTPIFDDQGSMQGLVGLAIDITERNEAQRRIQEKVSFIDNMLRSSVDMAIAATDLDFHITYYNPMAEKLFGYTSQEAIGKTVQEIHTKEKVEPERFERAIKIVRETGEYHYTVEKEVEDGIQYIESRVSGIWDENGELTGFLLMSRDVTERKRAEGSIKSSEAKFRTIFASSSDAIMMLDSKGFFDCNNATLRIFGCPSKDQFLNRHPSEWSPAKQPCGTDSMSLTNERINTAFKDGINQFEWMHKRMDGFEFPAEVLLTAMKLDGKDVLQATVRDITERRKAEAKIKSLSRTLKAISACNKALIHAKDESGLLADICKIVVEIGGYRLAWVGEAVEENGERLVKPVACDCDTGIKCDYLTGIRITWSGDEFGQGPTGTATRTGKPAVMRSIENDPMYAPWREKALQHGFRSSLTLPLVVSGKMFGVLNIYSGREDAFDREECLLLEEMAADLTFGITTLRTLKDKKRHGRLIELLLDSTSEGVYGVDTSGDCTFANASCLKMLGYDDESELLGKNMYSLLHHTRSDGSPFPIEECPLYHAYSKGKRAHVDDEFFRRSDGTSFPVSYRAVPVFSEGKLTGAVVTFLDITEQLQAREALERSGKQLKSALDGTITAVSRMIEARDPYTSGHEARVALLACNIAREMGLDENIVEGIRMGATIHDIGKIHLPAEILSKPTRLTPVEFDLIKAHPQTGHDILADISFPWPVADIAWQHHEKLDGSGYPQGLKNGEICLEARIVAVADVVEAMASHRPYRPALGIEKALEEIKAHRGGWYDPSAVDACIKLFTEKGFSLDTPT